MIRITVVNTLNNSTIRMELEPYETVADIIDNAAEFWGKDAGAYVLRKGPALLNPKQTMEELNLCDNDAVELVPDPEGGRRCDFRGPC